MLEILGWVVLNFFWIGITYFVGLCLLVVYTIRQLNRPKYIIPYPEEVAK